MMTWVDVWSIDWTEAQIGWRMPVKSTSSPGPDPRLAVACHANTISGRIAHAIAFKEPLEPLLKELVLEFDALFATLMSASPRSIADESLVSLHRVMVAAFARVLQEISNGTDDKPAVAPQGAMPDSDVHMLAEVHAFTQEDPSSQDLPSADPEDPESTPLHLPSF
jgi:hypothetical protein